MHLLVWSENLAVINLDRVRASNPDDYSKLAYLVRTQYYSLHLNKKISPKMILILSSKFESDIFTILAFAIPYTPDILLKSIKKHNLELSLL